MDNEMLAAGEKDMRFVKEFRKVRDPFPEWEYLNKIGVRDFRGKPLRKYTTELVVDRENNYYLIGRGTTNPNRDERELWFYALCLDGNVINMEVERHSTGNAREKNFECHWIIDRIDLPINWTFDVISKAKLEDIIVEAFTVEYYSSMRIPERIKNVTVEITASIEVTNEEKNTSLTL